MNEIWRSIPGYEGYEASNLGRIRSVDRAVPHATYGEWKCRGRVLSLHPDKDGYHRLSLSLLGGKSVYRGAHCLVALAWIGPCPDGFQVNHKNGNKCDNHPENLEYITPKENTIHALHCGLKPVRGQHGRAVLNESRVKKVRERLALGHTIRSIAVDEGVCPATIGHIKSGRNWRVK